MATFRLTICIAVAALATLSTAASAGSAADTAPAGKRAGERAEKASSWRLFTGAKQSAGSGLLAVGYASNRTWLVTVEGSKPVLHSARVSAGRLSSFVAARIPADIRGLPVVSGELVLDKGSEDDRTFAAAPLLANGRLGPATIVSDELLEQGKAVAPKFSSILIYDGVRVGGRTVWVFGGNEESRGLGGGPGFLLACCSETGAAVDLTRFIDRRSGDLFLQLGVDARGRVWLAWLDSRNYSSAVRGVPRLLQLDRSSLAPRTGALAVPGVVADRIALACAASCRVVLETEGDIVSWAHGERSPIRIATHGRSKWVKSQTYPLGLLGAEYRSNRLVVAYFGEFVRGSKGTREIRVLRGDARGARGSVVGATPLHYGWPPGKQVPPYLEPLAYGTFVPGGFVALEHFQISRNYSSPVIYAFIPLGR